jgi:hypothetical protein
LDKIMIKSAKSYYYYIKGLSIFEFPLYPIHNIVLRDWASEGNISGFATEDFISHLKENLMFFKEALSWERGLHHFDFALILEDNDYFSLTQKGLQLNQPLKIQKIQGSGNQKKLSFLHQPLQNIIITDIHPFEEGYLLRLYNPQNQPVKASLDFDNQIKSIHILDHIQFDKKSPMQILSHNHQADYNFSPFEIINLYLTMD